MTKAEMERAIRNLDRRLVNVEQILPTLATKTDLSELKRHTSIQFEALRDDIRMVVEAVAAIPARFDEMNARFARIDARSDRLEGVATATASDLKTLTQRFDRLEGVATATAGDVKTLTQRFDQLEGVATATAGDVKTLTQRLTERGVI